MSGSGAFLAEQGLHGPARTRDPGPLRLESNQLPSARGGCSTHMSYEGPLVLAAAKKSREGMRGGLGPPRMRGSGGVCNARDPQWKSGTAERVPQGMGYAKSGFEPDPGPLRIRVPGARCSGREGPLMVAAAVDRGRVCVKALPGCKPGIWGCAASAYRRSASLDPCNACVGRGTPSHNHPFTHSTCLSVCLTFTRSAWLAITRSMSL